MRVLRGLVFCCVLQGFLLIVLLLHFFMVCTFYLTFMFYVMVDLLLTLCGLWVGNLVLGLVGFGWLVAFCCAGGKLCLVPDAL